MSKDEQLLKKAWQLILEANKLIEQISPSVKERLGEKAMEYIGDYPLYAATSNILYTEAIAIQMNFTLLAEILKSLGKEKNEKDNSH